MNIEKIVEHLKYLEEDYRERADNASLWGDVAKSDTLYELEKLVQKLKEMFDEDAR